ncbi:hypothetical protein [Pseudomonas sp. S9]|uniref:hypothetical protein n=1 Tax=Pseudomonas sp. S9 TaxID=686578 RepID=UPI0002556CF6|nr:hypothetical protein [Pseudomonas sp. S9]
MHKILRVLVACLMLFALPVQNMAVINMQNCLSLSQLSVSESPQCHSLETNTGDTGHQSIASQLCMHCSMCLSAAALAAPLLKTPTVIATTLAVQPSPRFIGHIGDLPKRPPRNDLV